MSLRLRIHHPSPPRPCEHFALVTVAGHPGYGRCLGWSATVATPFTLR